MKCESNSLVSNQLPQILLIQAGTPPDELRDVHGDLPLWFSRAMALAPDAIQVVKVFSGETLPNPDPNRIAVITGSWDMVTDKLEWSENTAKWIRYAIEAGMPLFGVCYGHQLMAHALGGTVDYHPQGREMGCLDINLTEEGTYDPLTRGFSEGFRAHLTHLQTVTKLPPGAQSLASSTHDKNQIIRYSAKAVSTQFHPEFTPDIAASLIHLRSETLVNEGFEPAGMRSALTDATDARELLNIFISIHAAQALTVIPECEDTINN
ncbi:glutamine amidotransferase [Kluyvera ascorbata]|uniref:glutamine amidotransferase n=1 Tax=Kluyvera ascorbata TaxID=51288 RepID=UPI002057121B|nr:glutamine amidotransferase [Kluyvera ascorbata]UPQ70140.1 glutamine amidotransferase [Kluyvera ascorbata]